MIDPENIKLSTYSKIWLDKKNPEAPVDLYLNHILEGIKKGKWKAHQEAYINSGFDKKVKEKLPNFSASGTFKAPTEAGIATPSGLICLDFSRVDDLEGAKKCFLNDRYVKYFFKSVSGTGYFVLVEIDFKRFYDAFDGLEKYFLENYGLISDKKGRFMSTRRIFSYDPQAQIENNSNEVFKLYIPKSKSVSKAKRENNINSDNDIEHVIRQIENRQADITGGFSNWYNIGFGLITTYGKTEKALSYFARISQFNPDYTEEKIKSLFKYLSDRHNPDIKIGALYASAREFGIDPYTDETINIARVASQQRRAGSTAASVIKSLQEMDKIDSKLSGPIVDAVFSDEGEIESEESTIQQIEMFLKRNFPMRYNLVEHQTELISGEPITDRMVNGVYIELKKSIGKEVTKQDIEAIIESPLTPSYNPILDFFERNKALRPTGRVAALASSITPNLNDYCKDKFPQFVEYFLLRWLIGLVASPHGDASPLMLVLTGAQNTGKSEFFHRILPAELYRYFDDSKQESVKDEEMLLTQKWLILDDEFSGKNKKEERRFKEISSKKKITQRVPYGKRAESRQRIAVLAGTCNDTNILNDPTGNRRVIPIEVVKIDHALYNSVNKIELLMEVYHKWKEGYSHHLTNEEIKYLNAATLEFEQHSLERELILKYFSIPEPGQISEILTATDIKVVIEKNSIQRVTLNKIGQELKSLGFNQKVFRRNGSPSQGYEVNRTTKNLDDTGSEDYF